MSTRERKKAKSVLAQEYRYVDDVFKEDEDDKRSANYVVLPSGEKVNRLYVAGTVTETEKTATDVWKMKVNDGSGNFLVYASSEFDPEAAEDIEKVDPPEFVAIVGKAAVIETDEEEDDNISHIKPEFVAQVDRTTREKSIAEAAERTMDRLEQEKEADEEAERLYGENRKENVKKAVEEALENL
jgi:RPA family protein